MIKNIITLTVLAVSTPLVAHEGMVLESTVHQLLHVGSDMAAGLGGILIACIAAVAARRVIRARHTAAARSGAARPSLGADDLG